MSNGNATSEADARLMKLAKKRVKAKREFVWHLATYVLVNSFLIFIFLTTSGIFGYFWPMWPIMGWGLGLALHGVSLALTLSDNTGSDNKIMEEYNRLKQSETDELRSVVKDLRDDRSN